MCSTRWGCTIIPRSTRLAANSSASTSQVRCPLDLRNFALVLISASGCRALCCYHFKCAYSSTSTSQVRPLPAFLLLMPNARFVHTGTASMLCWGACGSFCALPSWPCCCWFITGQNSLHCAASSHTPCLQSWRATVCKHSFVQLGHPLQSPCIHSSVLVNSPPPLQSRTASWLWRWTALSTFQVRAAARLQGTVHPKCCSPPARWMGKWAGSIQLLAALYPSHSPACAALCSPSLCQPH